MTILVGLVIATFLVIGWACGSIFACVFMTLPVAVVALIFAFQDTGARTGSMMICLGIIAVIWAPRSFMQFVDARARKARDGLRLGLR
jgi:hypothetical protein